MTKIYMFSYQSMCEDLLNNSTEEENIEEAAEEILGELRTGRVIEVGDTYIIGNLTAWLLQERYKVQSYEQLLI